MLVLFGCGFFLAFKIDKRTEVDVTNPKLLGNLKPNIETTARKTPIYFSIGHGIESEFELDENTEAGPYCEKDYGCGLAKACIENKCQPCTLDQDCASEEVCVLQNCLLVENVDCFGNDECEDGKCVLSGYSYGVRSNKDMKAFCRDSIGGEPQITDLVIEKQLELSRGPKMQPTNSFSDLRKGLKYVQTTDQ